MSIKMAESHKGDKFKCLRGTTHTKRVILMMNPQVILDLLNSAGIKIEKNENRDSQYVSLVKITVL